MNQRPWSLNKASKITYNEQQLADYFKKELDKGEAVIMTVYGPPNIGKSESSMQLLRYINPSFSIERDWCNTLDRFYSITECLNEEYPTKVLDDFGPEIAPTKNWDEAFQDFKDYLSYIRTERVIIIITTQHTKFLNKDVRERLATHYLELKKKIRKRNVVKAVIQLMQRNIKLDRVYYHNLSMTKDGVVNHLGQGDRQIDWELEPLPKKEHKEYKPLRIQLGKQARTKGKSRLNALGTDKTHQEIAEEVCSNLEYYTKITKKGRKYINKALIEAEKNLGDRQAKKVIALVEAKIKNNPSFKEPQPKDKQRIQQATQDINTA